MKLHIGLTRSLERPPEGVSEVGVVRGGPEQLLSWLETQLGLNGPAVEWTDRVVAYHHRLKGLDGVFKPSFDNDPWATASHLLKRRDALLLAGWDRSPVGPPLVHDMARAEPMPPMVPGTPERLAWVLEALEAGQKLPAHTLWLEGDAWPALWMRVLAHMDIPPVVAATARADGALGTIQRNLLECREDPAVVDATLVACTSSSRVLAVQFLARWLAKRSATVYCPDGATATLLDGALRANGVPTMGAMRETRAHPAQQVLPLTIGLLWEPVNPYVLLDFLVLPIGPVRSIGHTLSRALEKQPGYGSDAWNEAMAEVKAKGDAKTLKKVERWLDHTRIPQGQDAPSRLVEDRCAAVAQWAAGRASLEAERDEPDHELVQSLLGAAGQARALGQLVAQLGATVSEAQLSRLLDEVRAEASMDVAFPAEAGGPRIVTSLADVPVTEHLVWLGTHDMPMARTPWTPGEAAALAEAGIDVADGPLRRARRDAEIRGLCRAARLLIIELPAEESQSHPLWLQIHSSLEIHGSRAGALPHLDGMLDMVPTQTVTPTPAAEAPQVWHALRPLPEPERVSATSLETQLACPLKWTLRHSLNIRPSVVASIPEDVRLKGNFGHELLESVFTPGAPPTPEEAAVRMEQAFDDQLGRNAAPLAVPRKMAERNRLRRDLRDAARNLAATLRAGAYTVVGLEVPTEGELDGKQLKSYIDCVVQGPDGEAIIDFKLGGAAKRKEEIERGRALQLATYAHARSNGSPVRRGGYFILSSSELVTPTAGAIEGATSTITGPDLATTWQRFHDALAGASDWIKTGDIPVRPLQDPAAWDRGATVALDAEAASQGVCTYCDYGALCGRRVLR